MRPDPVRFALGARPVFGRSAPTADPAAAPAAGRGKAAARHRRQVREAAELCPDLPAPGEHVHCLMTGFFHLAQVVADVAARTRPRRLRIATLGWNRRNLADLAGVVERRAAAGDPLPVVLVGSDFFASHYPDLVADTRAAFEPPGGCVVSARSHAKVTVFDLGPGDGLTFEGSANLRTNRNQEQLTIIRDRTTHDWHAAWIDQLVGAAA